MRELLIFGSGGHARSVVSLIKIINKWNILGIVDINYDKHKNKDEYILGVRVVLIDEFKSKIDGLDIDIFIACGDNNLRESIFRNFENSKVGFPNIIHPTALIDKSSSFGFGNYIGQYSNLGAEVKIGNFNIINSYANLEHQVHIGDFNQLAPSSTVCGVSTLSDNIFLGANACIIDHLSIARNTVIGAGATVIRSINQPNNRFVGVPAKKI